MSSIANTIYQAIVNHTQWKKHLHDIVEQGHHPDDFSLEQDQFDKWLKANAQELSRYEHYSKVVELNRKLHYEAQRIIHLALTGKSAEAKTLIEYGSDFEHLSQNLVQNIIAWHDTVIGKK